MRLRGRADQRLDQLPRGRIEIRPRLVEQQQLWVVQRCPGNGRTLHHPTGQCLQWLLGAVHEPHGRQYLLDAILLDAV